MIIVSMDESATESYEARPTVLLVEDEDAVREIYTLQLQEEYDVQTAVDGDVSVDRIRDQIDIVLTDRRMPGTSGVELLERLRDCGITTPVVLVSAVNPDDVPDVPFQDYLTKPVTGAELKAAIEQHTDQSRTAAD